ncbi:ABC transporter substrate-binding protein [Streptomyces sp. NPDC013178]|uniref:ABC transporter substrate-binding protein n=1 Tax=Streptomyces sp. NPDC013178 TaxID=3155118 RepID=UPI0033D12995
MTRRSPLLLVICAVVVGIAGCGDSDDSADGAGKGPIKVMTLGTFDAPVIGWNLANVPAAIEARAKTINANGGINGRKIEVIECNSAADPNKAAICGRKAVSEKVAAIVRTNIAPTDEAGLYAILNKAKIPVIGANVSTSVGGSSPVAFPLANEEAFAYVQNALSAAGAKKISVVGSADTKSPEGTAGAIAAIKASGAQPGQIVYVPGNTVDYTPYAAKAIANGVDGVAVVAFPQTNPSVVRALRAQGFKGKIGAASLFMEDKSIKALGDVANGMIFVGQYAPITADLPAMKMYRDDIAKYAQKYPRDEFSVGAWLAMWTFERIAKKLDTVDNESVLDAMSKLTDYDQGGITPPLTTTKPGKSVNNPKITRAFNPFLTYSVLNDGKYSALTKGKLFHNPVGEEE